MTGGPTLRLVPAARDGELAASVARHPAGRDPGGLRAALAAAEAQQARATSSRTGRARLRAAHWLCGTGARVHAAARALAERVAP